MNFLRSSGWVFFAAAVLSPACLIGQAIQVNKENRTIAVTATDKVVALADTATVHIGFIAYAADSDSAYANGSRISNAIVSSLRSSGVPADAIESENQAISPVQVYQNERLSPEDLAQRKFQLVQSWTVRTNAADAAKVLGLAVKAGANQSGQIDWSLQDEDAPEAAAAAKALARARTVAQQMAAQLNAKVGVLIYASNQIQANTVRPLGMRSLVAKNMEMLPLAINPRQIEKTATVYAVFAIE